MRLGEADLDFVGIACRRGRIWEDPAVTNRPPDNDAGHRGQSGGMDRHVGSRAG